jgi:hypothetical protein
MLQEELKRKCKHDKKLKWPSLFLRFIDDGFGIMEGTKKDVEYWILQFNNLRKSINIDKWSFGNHVEYMDLYIYKGEKFYSSGFLDFRIFQKEINRYMYIPQKSGHVSHTIKNYVLGELKRYIRYNSLKLTFLKIRTLFFSRLRNRGFKKIWLRKQFTTLKYEDRKKLMLEKEPDSTFSHSAYRSDSAREKGRKPLNKKKLFGRPWSFPQRQHNKPVPHGTSPNKERYVRKSFQSRSSNTTFQEAIQQLVKCCHTGATKGKTLSRAFPTKISLSKNSRKRDKNRGRKNLGKGRKKRNNASRRKDRSQNHLFGHAELCRAA